MAYFLADTRLTPARLQSRYEAPRRPLLDRGIGLGDPPDSPKLRHYLLDRQRAEELAAGELAVCQLERGR